jgi:hypothetical protein
MARLARPTKMARLVRPTRMARLAKVVARVVRMY